MFLFSCLLLRCVANIIFEAVHAKSELKVRQLSW